MRPRRIDLPIGADSRVPLVVGRRLRDNLDPTLEQTESSQGRLPRRTTNYGPLPYIGETREEKAGIIRSIPKPAAPGASFVIATLTRPWPIVGFGVDPGNLPAGGGANVLTIQLFALVQRNRVLVATLALNGGGGPQGLIGQQIGARAELAVFVPSTIAPGTLTNLSGTLWGFTTE